MDVIITILPIFIIISLGWLARKRGFITSEFLDPANKLVYYLSIPAMIFSAIAKSDFHEQFDGTVLSLTLLAVAIIYFIAFIISRSMKMMPNRSGAFIQSSGHGNVGYIGLPIAFYYLGEAGFAKAGILAGFMMILQNLLSIITLQLHDVSGRGQLEVKSVVTKLMGNPVITSAMAGIVVSFFNIPLPTVIGRSLDILGGLAPPMALLLIGASLSVSLLRNYLHPTLGATVLKLLVLPVIGLLLFNVFQLDVVDYLPALILLCSPTATVAYIMTKEMHSDADFAAATISASTFFSSITVMTWLALVSHMTG